MRSSGRSSLLLALALSGTGSAPAVDASIAEAIRREREALLLALEHQLSSRLEDYPMGRIALSTAAVLEAGIAPGNAIVARAFQKLARMPIRETYSAVCYLVAIDASRQALLADAMAARTRDRTSPAAGAGRDDPLRAKMDALVEFLLGGSGGVWSYGGRDDGDLSNTQFAMLGLEIALENDVPVPVEVFSEVAGALLETRWRSSAPFRFTIGYIAPGWPGVVPETRRSVERSAAPAGWNYELDPEMTPSAAMTAAGVSSLLIARKGLRRAFALSHELGERIDRAILEGLAWIVKRRDEFRQPYALYSLEKVCDLAGIELLDGKDWHAEGARHYIEARARGGMVWDTSDHGLALLFLCRATRSRLHVHGPPVFITPRGSEPVPAEGEDLVYVSAAAGFIPAEVIFEFAASSRSPRLGAILDEALKAIPPGRSHEALSRILWVWTDDADGMTAWARRAAGRIAGGDVPGREACAALAASFAEIYALERSDAPSPDRVGAILSVGGSPALARRALDLVERTGMAEVFGEVAALVADSNPGVRRRAHEVLERWTGLRFQAPPGPGGDRTDILESARPWEAWWQESGVSFCTRRRAAALIEDMERADTPEVREASLDAVVALGPGAVPAILDAMDRGKFSIHVVRALEKITGESRGLRANDWKR